MSGLGEAGKKKKDVLLVLAPGSRVSSRSPSELSLARPAKKQKLDDLSLRLQSFKNAKLLNGCLTPANGSNSPLLQEQIQSLFVRKCYKACSNC